MIIGVLAVTVILSIVVQLRGRLPMAEGLLRPLAPSFPCQFDRIALLLATFGGPRRLFGSRSAFASGFGSRCGLFGDYFRCGPAAFGLHHIFEFADFLIDRLSPELQPLDCQ